MKEREHVVRTKISLSDRDALAYKLVCMLCPGHSKYKARRESLFLGKYSRHKNLLIKSIFRLSAIGLLNIKEEDNKIELCLRKITMKKVLKLPIL